MARDRLGIKPLHWAEAGGRFYAASELKSLRGLPGLSLTLDEVAVDQYFSLLYVPAPRTIFREIKKLPPGYLLVKDPGQPAVIRRYWQLHSRLMARVGGGVEFGGAARPRRRRKRHLQSTSGCPRTSPFALTQTASRKSWFSYWRMPPNIRHLSPQSALPLK